MQRRAAAPGLKFRLRSAPGQGTRLTLRVLLPAPEETNRAGAQGALGQ